MDVSLPGAQDRRVAAPCRACPRGRPGDRLEGAKTHVRALQTIGGPRQTEGASLHGHSTRVDGLHLGDRTGIAATGRQSIRREIMFLQCVGSRMDNGGRTLAWTMRHVATH